MICAFFCSLQKHVRKVRFSSAVKTILSNKLKDIRHLINDGKQKKPSRHHPYFQFQNIFALLTLFTSIFAEIHLPSASRPERND